MRSRRIIIRKTQTDSDAEPADHHHHDEDSDSDDGPTEHVDAAPTWYHVRVDGVRLCHTAPASATEWYGPYYGKTCPVWLLLQGAMGRSQKVGGRRQYLSLDRQDELRVGELSMHGQGGRPSCQAWKEGDGELCRVYAAAVGGYPALFCGNHDRLWKTKAFLNLFRDRWAARRECRRTLGPLLGAAEEQAMHEDHLIELCELEEKALVCPSFQVLLFLLNARDPPSSLHSPRHGQSRPTLSLGASHFPFPSPLPVYPPDDRGTPEGLPGGAPENRRWACRAGAELEGRPGAARRAVPAAAAC